MGQLTSPIICVINVKDIFNSNYTFCVNQACPCQREQDVLFDLPIAMAYVPWQKWEKIYDIQKRISPRNNI